MGRIVFGLGGLAVFALLPFGSQIAEVATRTDNQGIGQESNSLLLATLSSGEIEFHWLPHAICERVALEVAARSLVWGVRFDGSRVLVSSAQCRPGNSELARN